MDIQNWGFNYENEVAIGYLLKAFNLMDKKIPQNTQNDIIEAMKWAFDELTAEEAYKLYLKS